MYYIHDMEMQSTILSKNSDFKEHLDYFFKDQAKFSNDYFSFNPFKKAPKIHFTQKGINTILEKRDVKKNNIFYYYDYELSRFLEEIENVYAKKGKSELYNNIVKQNADLSGREKCKHLINNLKNIAGVDDLKKIYTFEKILQKNSDSRKNFTQILKNMKNNSFQLCICEQLSPSGQEAEHFEAFAIVNKNGKNYLLQIDNSYMAEIQGDYNDLIEQKISLPMIQRNDSDCSILAIEFLKHISKNNFKMANEMISSAEQMTNKKEDEYTGIILPFDAEKFPVLKYMQSRGHNNFENISNSNTKKRSKRICYDEKIKKHQNHGLIDKGISYVNLLLNDVNIREEIKQQFNSETDFNHFAGKVITYINKRKAICDSFKENDLSKHDIKTQNLNNDNNKQSSNADNATSVQTNSTKLQKQTTRKANQYTINNTTNSSNDIAYNKNNTTVNNNNNNAMQEDANRTAAVNNENNSVAITEMEEKIRELDKNRPQFKVYEFLLVIVLVGIILIIIKAVKISEYKDKRNKLKDTLMDAKKQQKNIKKNQLQNGSNKVQNNISQKNVVPNNIGKKTINYSIQTSLLSKSHELNV